MDGDIEQVDRSESGGVAVLGLGLMGSALAKAFLESGASTAVWNRSADKATDLVAAGAARIDTVGAAFAPTTTTVICVSDNAAVLELFELAGDRLSASRIVNFTSSTPEQARELAAVASAANAIYIDGAILAIPPFIGQPEAMLLYSGGEKEAFDAVAGTLAALGTNTYLGSDVGRAAIYDLALLGTMWSTLIGFIQSAALLRTESVSAEHFTPLAGTWLTGMIGVLPQLAEEIDRRDYATDVSSLDTHAAAIEHLVEVSEAQGVDGALPETLKSLIDRGVAAGHGPESLASLVELLGDPPRVV